MRAVAAGGTGRRGLQFSLFIPSRMTPAGAVPVGFGPFRAVSCRYFWFPLTSLDVRARLGVWGAPGARDSGAGAPDLCGLL